MRRHLICILALAMWAGCIHTPIREEAPELPPEAPSAGEILADLTRADRAFTSFSSNGTIRMRLPGQAATQRFTSSFVRLQPPDRFYARAMKLTQGVHIYVDGDTFLLDHESERVFYFGREGDRFEDVALQVSPSVVFREYFLTDTLAGRREAQFELLAYDAERNEAQLGLFTSGRQRRQERHLWVSRGASGWQVDRNDLLGTSGEPVAETRYTNYDRVDDVFMPRRIETMLPQSDGLLSFEIQSNAQANRSNPMPIEDPLTVRAALLAAGYREVHGIPSEGITP